MNELKNKGKFLRDVWYLTKSYWQSEEKGKAYLLLTAIIALTLGVVYMLVLLNKWNNSFIMRCKITRQSLFLMS